jgi:hypothetical protein
MIFSGIRPANHDGTEHADDSASQPLNRLFERHTEAGWRSSLETGQGGTQRRKPFKREQLSGPQRKRSLPRR